MGYRISKINSVIFVNRQNIPWNDVEQYLKRYILDSRKRDEDTTSRIAANP